MSSAKILPFESAGGVFDDLRNKGKRLVQCHGTFDLVHPGHIYHLEEAKELGDILVVTITSEKFVNKGPGRPYFNDVMRSKSLSALACVDYVVLIPHPAAVEAIDLVKPDVYCKGREYENPVTDVTGNINNDVTTVEKHGGQIRYIGSVVFSSSKLLNRHFEHVPASVKEFSAKLFQTVSPDQLREAVDSFAGLKVLVIGDIIFDRYSYLKVQGLTSKNRIISGRFLNEETQAGGALAVYRHLKQFCDKVDMISLIGTEDWAEKTLGDFLSPDEDKVIRDSNFTTIIKQRYVEPTGEEKELSKLFSVNYINGEPPSEETVARVIGQIEGSIADYDLVMVIDFGHGLMQESVRRLVESKAAFLALNCQTNSNNHGFNIISHQYKKADSFSLDEQELLLSSARRHINHVEELQKLRALLKADYAWLTRGSVETIGLKGDSKPCTLIPLESRVTDTVGAGDAFYSVASLAACKGFSNELCTFLGQLAGAQAVRIVGNSDCVSKQALLKSGMALLNF